MKNFKNLMMIVLVGVLNQNCANKSSDSNKTNSNPAATVSQQNGNTEPRVSDSSGSGSNGASTPIPTSENNVEYWQVRMRSTVTNGIGSSIDPDLDRPPYLLPYFTGAPGEINVQSLLMNNYDPTQFLKSIHVAIEGGQSGFQYNSVPYDYACIRTNLEFADAHGLPVNVSSMTRVMATVQLMDISGKPMGESESVWVSRSNDCSVDTTYNESMNGTMLLNGNFSFRLNLAQVEPFLANPDLGRSNKTFLKVRVQIIPDSTDKGFKPDTTYSFPLLVKTY